MYMYSYTGAPAPALEVAAWSGDVEEWPAARQALLLCMFMCVCKKKYIYIYIHIHIYIYVYTYVYTHTHTILLYYDILEYGMVR